MDTAAAGRKKMTFATEAEKAAYLEERRLKRNEGSRKYYALNRDRICARKKEKHAEKVAAKERETASAV